MTAPSLVFPDLNKWFIIYENISYYCTVDVLSQEYEIWRKIQERPLDDVASHFSPTQLTYAVIEKEVHAVYNAVQRYITRTIFGSDHLP